MGSISTSYIEGETRITRSPVGLPPPEKLIGTIPSFLALRARNASVQSPEGKKRSTRSPFEREKHP